MSASIVQSKSAAQNTGLATVTATWTSAASAGNTLLVIAAADDYRTAGGTPSGFTQSTGCGQETFLGHYLWWKVAAGGETSTTYTIGSASPSCWITMEISGLTGSPYDISNGQFTQTSATNYTTPAITPTSGDRFLVGSIGGSLNANFSAGQGSWLNSFTEVPNGDIVTTLGSGTRDSAAASSFAVTANGSTAYSTGSTWDGGSTPQSRTGIIVAFKVAGAAAAIPPRLISQYGTYY